MSNHIAEAFDVSFSVLDRVFTKGCFAAGCGAVIVYHIILLTVGAAIGRFI